MSLALRLTGARRRAQIVATRRNDAICGTVDPAETEARLSVVLDAAVRHLGDRHPVTLNTRCVLGAVRHLGPRWREAEARSARRSRGSTGGAGGAVLAVARPHDPGECAGVER